MSSHDVPARSLTHQVHVGEVVIGGGSPVSVQSMCTTKTDDPESTLAQIRDLADAGCEIVRVAIPGPKVLDGFSQICQGSVLPVVADIHFDYKLAIEAARRGAAGLRINPGNIGSFERVDAVIDAATESSSLKNELGLNSIGMLYIMITIEEKFDVSFENTNANDFQTVGDVIDFIEANA